ncbi:hypothetical protein ACLVWU_11445 [Bdellovibrio sp. HCB290]|uniref:hypothetical protein n=1 Tax=Bdellovibrio sp. HCB290 TaxID=3394356 RepID=UPI0039B404D3
MTSRSGVYVFTFVMFTALGAGAYPSIGDKVTWSGTFKDTQGKTSEIKITKEVISFNSDSKQWKVKKDTKVGDETVTETLETADLFTPDKFKEVLKTCVQQGGVIETLETNPGKYETCKTSTTDARGVIIEKWWGDIPFGIVSKSTRGPSGELTAEELPLMFATLGL